MNLKQMIGNKKVADTRRVEDARQAENIFVRKGEGNKPDWTLADEIKVTLDHGLLSGWDKEEVGDVDKVAREVASYIENYDFKYPENSQGKEQMVKDIKDYLVRNWNKIFIVPMNVSDSVDKIEDAKGGVRDDIKDALSILVGITKSGYIPFASPAPSSTEVKVKNAINNAISSLYDALDLDESLYGR